jgi:hypothetical protein
MENMRLMLDEVTIDRQSVTSPTPPTQPTLFPQWWETISSQGCVIGPTVSLFSNAAPVSCCAGRAR